MKPAFLKLFKSETFLSILLILLTTVITHGLRISSLGYYHDEWFPFFEGLVNVGREEDARKIVKQEFKGRERLRYLLCQTLSNDPGYPQDYGYQYPKIREILCDS